ncbi:MAG: DUF1217 domain-containing protein [Methyloligellaceae bacterium]
MLTTVAGYRAITGNLDRSLENAASEPVVARQSARFLERIEKVKSIDDFLADDTVYSYAMKAFGLEEMTFARAFMRKVLTEGVGTSDTFANSLADTRYREFAQVFNFAEFGETTTVFDRTRQGTVDRYVRQTLEEDAGNQSEGLRLALYFARKAPRASNVFELLGDRAMLTVVQTGLGIPAAASSLDIDKQAAQISAQLDIEDFSDPEKLDTFLHRFSTLWDLQNPSSSTTVPNIIIGGPRIFGIDAGLLQSIQGLRFGGN